jgi:hypothetical protein
MCNKVEIKTLDFFVCRELTEQNSTRDIKTLHSVRSVWWSETSILCECFSSREDARGTLFSFLHLFSLYWRNTTQVYWSAWQKWANRIECRSLYHNQDVCFTSLLLHSYGGFLDNIVCYAWQLNGIFFCMVLINCTAASILSWSHKKCWIQNGWYIIIFVLNLRWSDNKILSISIWFSFRALTIRIYFNWPTQVRHNFLSLLLWIRHFFFFCTDDTFI